MGCDIAYMVVFFDLPVEIQRVIYGFDPTFHMDVFENVLSELRGFWRKTQYDLTLGLRFSMHRDGMMEKRTRGLLDPILRSMVGENDHGSDEDLFQRYADIRVSESRKQDLFLMIKMNTPSEFTFRHHVFILERLVHDHHHKNDSKPDASIHSKGDL